MKIEFIKRGAETRLILLFAGWSTDRSFYSDCVVDGWDTAVISDYRDMSMPEIPSQYSTIYIYAYSLGVFAATHSKIDATARIAICGSEVPVSDEYGIPKAIYRATADGLDVNSLKKFHRRMAGDRATISRIDPLLPKSPDFDMLKSELYAIEAIQNQTVENSKWDKVYIAKQDRIFPYENLNRFWSRFPDTVKVEVDSSHAIDISKIIKDVIPNPTQIGKGFSIATDTYKQNALVQADICSRIGEILNEKLSERDAPVGSLLEIGVGRGLLTEVWQNIVRPTNATYVDLLPMPKFDIANNEEYIVADAEEWLKNSTAKYDIILSASTIQWFADPINFIQKVKSHLNPGGIAIISTFTKGNLHELDAIRACPIIYRSVEDYATVSDIIIDEWERTLTFATPREMMMHLRRTGVSPRQNRAADAERKTHKSSTAGKLSILPISLTYRPLILLVTTS